MTTHLEGGYVSSSRSKNFDCEGVYHHLNLFGEKNTTSIEAFNSVVSFLYSRNPNESHWMLIGLPQKAPFPTMPIYKSFVRYTSTITPRAVMFHNIMFEFYAYIKNEFINNISSIDYSYLIFTPPKKIEIRAYNKPLADHLMYTRITLDLDNDLNCLCHAPK